MFLDGVAGDFLILCSELSIMACDIFYVVWVVSSVC